MANGPPPSAAESSGRPNSTNRYESFISTPNLPAQSPASAQAATPFQVSHSASSSISGSTSIQRSSLYNYGYWSQYPTATAYAQSMDVPTGSGSTLNTTTPSQYHPHYNYQGYYPTPIPHQFNVPTHQPAYPPKVKEEEAQPPPLKSPSPPPPSLESYRHWDEAIRAFLGESGFHETLRGFENDMLMLSPDWEQDRIPKALQSLVKRLTGVSEYPKVEDTRMIVDGEDIKASLDERKLTYMNLADGAVPRTPTSVNRSISQLLAKNRAKNNASNRSEFLYSLTERRRQIQERTQNSNDDSESPATIDPGQLGSCARTDAKPINRDEQMKYDIAKNNDGPLSRTTMKQGEGSNHDRSATSLASGTAPTSEELLRRQQDEEYAIPSRYPALDERLKNVESHFAIRYVPSPPRTLVSRLKFLEEHIIKLEKEYPPWAALHFNQPNRGWPPPPRTTPIIVPPNLRSTEPIPSAGDAASYSSTQQSMVAGTTDDDGGSGSASSSSKAPGKQRNAKSSLHRAVMEKLQVQQAMNDLGGH